MNNPALCCVVSVLTASLFNRPTTNTREDYSRQEGGGLLVVVCKNTKSSVVGYCCSEWASSKWAHIWWHKGELLCGNVTCFRWIPWVKYVYFLGNCNWNLETDNIFSWKQKLNETCENNGIRTVNSTLKYGLLVAENLHNVTFVNTIGILLIRTYTVRFITSSQIQMEN
jgi:hypothetical protein